VSFNNYINNSRVGWGATPSKDVEEKPKRTLILCVDRDNDLGVKTEVETPVIGRDKNIYAAVKLLLRDPEEPDANAMFAAVKLYDQLVERAGAYENYQIATITGSELGDVGADRKLISELTGVLEEFPADDVILVTDGFSDEAVLPIIQSRLPVTSIRRIVVKHSESIEETAALFSRYMKMLWENPRYSRIALGLPGILMIVVCVLWLFNLLFYAWVAFFIIVGGFLFVRGFGIDRAVFGLYKWIREYSPPPLPRQVEVFSAVTGILLIAVGCYQAGAVVTPILQPPPANMGQWLALLPYLIGHFIAHSVSLIVIGVCVAFTGRAIRWFFERNPKLWRTIVIIVTFAWFQQILYQASQILINPELAYILQWQLVAATVTGILLTLATFMVTALLYRKFAHFFKGKEEEIEEFEEG